MARLGARVAVGYGRDDAAARRRSGRWAEPGVVLGADLAKRGEAERLVARAEEALGPLDVLVANHGIWKRAAIESMSAEQWDEMLDVNLGAVRALVSEAARRMVARGRGSIVLVASTAGQRGEPFHSHYAASKGAVIALTKSLGAELGPRGVRVNCVAPGWVMTEMSRAALDGATGDTIRHAIPLGRPGTPGEIAGPDRVPRLRPRELPARPDPVGQRRRRDDRLRPGRCASSSPARAGCWAGAWRRCSTKKGST